MVRVPKKENPQLLDKVIDVMQGILAAELGWLDHAFGRAERLVKMIDGRLYYTPNVYIGNNEYELIAPDSNFGNYCFFIVDDPQAIEWVPGETSTIKSPFSIVFWVDMRRIEDFDERNTEAVKRQILQVLNGRIFLPRGHVSFSRIYERAENVFAGFTLDEVDNQYLMHPFCGWRFEGEMTITDNCL